MPRQHRVVIAINDDASRKNIGAMLQAAEFLIIGEATDGITALKLIRVRQPDLVIAEVFLPAMSGLELARIVSDDKLAPVVLISSNYDHATLEEAKLAGAFGYLVKPVGEASLIPTVEIALSNYSEVVRLEEQVKELQEKLETRKIVEKAKGILMHTLGLTEAEAFRKIQKQSMNKRISMRAVAEAIILAHSLD